ncbi:MAG: hypothetical protein LC660_10185 [Desulfobacteraceae bacterium]|nr:hypothetical protein [Desulfobacteraceae bacterium]
MFPSLSALSVLGTPYKPFGRMDQFSKLGFSAIAFAMAHAGMDLKDSVNTKKYPKRKKRNIAMIAGSRTGSLETDFLYQATLSGEKGILPSPALFAYTLPSCFLGEAAIYHGLTGETLMIEDEQGLGFNALSMAMDNLISGRYPMVVCGVCNCGSSTGTQQKSPEPGALFLVLQALDSDHPVRDLSEKENMPTITQSTREPLHFLCNESHIQTMQGLAAKLYDKTPFKEKK